MQRDKRKRGRISVFKGREAKLNHAIFHVLALKGPLTIYEVYKEVKALRHLKHTKYTNVNRRVRMLVEQGYIEKVGTRRTQAGFHATLYQPTPRAHLAILLNKVNLDNLIQKASEEGVLTMLTALISQMFIWESSSD